MKRLKRNRVQQRAFPRLMVPGFLLLVALLMQVGTGLAGTALGDRVEQAKQRFEVQLLGATEFGTVQLFQYLLRQTEQVVAVEPSGMHLEPGNPEACRAVWQVAAKKSEPVEVVRQLVAIIKELDPVAQNEVLYSSPFVVAENDLKQVKQAEPLEIGADSAVFVIAGVQERGKISQSVRAISTQNRWSTLPGAGFD